MFEFVVVYLTQKCILCSNGRVLRCRDFFCGTMKNYSPPCVKLGRDFRLKVPFCRKRFATKSNLRVICKNTKNNSVWCDIFWMLNYYLPQKK